MGPPVPLYHKRHRYHLGVFMIMKFALGIPLPRPSLLKKIESQMTQVIEQAFDEGS